MANCIIKFSSLVILVCLYGYSFAQINDAHAAYTWKKQVGRIIDISEKRGSSVHKMKSRGSLLKMILDEVKAGKITLYSNDDLEFTTKLTDEQLAEVTSMNDDVYKSIHQYRVLEDWSFNPYTGKTEIQIEGIAPIREIYGSDGSYRGIQAMFWVRYNDMVAMLDRDRKLHAGRSLTDLLWNDYFSPKTNPGGENPEWETEAIRIIGVSDKIDTVANHLTDYSDSSLFDMIAKRKNSGALASYANAGASFTNPLPPKDIIDNRLQKIDTQIISDPVSGYEVTKNIPHSLHNPYYRQEYSILEKWSFNMASGKIEAEITGIAPTAEITGNNDYFPKTRPEFWLKYEDVQRTISKYDEYNPGNSFSLQIWNSYFLSEGKPTVKN